MSQPATPEEPSAREPFELALRLVLAASPDAAVESIASWPERESGDGWDVAGRAARHELHERAKGYDDAHTCPKLGVE